MSTCKNIDDYKRQSGRPDLELGFHGIVRKDKTMRYFIAGYADKQGVAFGIVFGYVGGGEHQDWLVQDNNLVPDDGIKEYDEVEAEVEEQTYKGSINEVYAYASTLMEENEEGWVFLPKGEPGLYDFGAKISPLPYGNTY